MNGFLFFFSLACQQIQCQEMERTEKRMAWPLDKRTKLLPLSFLSENTSGEAPTVRIFLLNEKRKKEQACTTKQQTPKPKEATGLRMTEEEETKLGSLYKERKPVV